MEDRAISEVGPPARETVREVAISLEVGAPSPAPEAPGDGRAVGPDRASGKALLPELGELIRRPLALHRGRDIRGPRVPTHHASMSALVTSSDTSLRISSFVISVIRVS